MILKTSPTPVQLKKSKFSLLRQYTLTLLRLISRKKLEYSEGIPFLVAPMTDQDPAGSAIAWHEVDLGQALNPQSIASERHSEAAIKEMVVMVANDRFRDYFVLEVLYGHSLDEIMPKRFIAEIDVMRTGKSNKNLKPTFRQFFLWKYKIECINDKTMVVLQQIRSTICDLDTLLLAQEVQQQLHLHDVNLDSLRVALTTSSANRDYSYERLELLGDSFLKFSITIRLYIVNPTKNEGVLHMHRITIISNTALLFHCLRLELFRHITSSPFHRKNWRPVQFLVDAVPWDREHHHMLSNKTLADIVEALLGAAFRSGGTEVAFNAAKALGIPFDEFEAWTDFYRVHSEVMLNMAEDTKITRHNEFGSQIKKLEARIGYTFQHPHLAHQAMTHASSSALKHGLCYERLEFLGDAVLDFQVIRYYYNKYRDAPPGAITLIKDASVNNQILGAMAVQLGLGEFLIHSSGALASEIERAIVTIEKIKERSANGLLEGEYWVDVKIPKVLGDLVESTIGVVFHVNLDLIVIYPTKALLEFIQSKGCNDSRFGREEPMVAGRSNDSRAYSTLKRLGLRHGQRVGPTLECQFLVHGSLVASAKGTNMEELRKEVAAETMHPLTKGPELL
ncbi:hypothetical protein BGZ93_005546 [Podila epicladia]|nr:hypothetical protein BGZ93_005546 [Podila epicladia]